MDELELLELPEQSELSKEELIKKNMELERLLERAEEVIEYLKTSRTKTKRYGVFVQEKIQVEDKTKQRTAKDEISKEEFDKLKFEINRYKKSRGNRVSLGMVEFPHVGRIEFFYYEDRPETTYIGIDGFGYRFFDPIEKEKTRKMQSMIMKVAHRVNLVGQYSERRLRKRIERYKEMLESHKDV